MIEVQVYEALAIRTFASVLATIEIEYEDLHSRVSASWMWASVLDQMQFVLAKYRVSTLENRAAGKLLKYLEALISCEKNERTRREASVRAKLITPRMH